MRIYLSGHSSAQSSFCSAKAWTSPCSIKFKFLPILSGLQCHQAISRSREISGSSNLMLIICAGFPETTAKSGIFPRTTALAATITPHPSSAPGIKTASWLTFYLKQPHRLFPGTLMPDPDLSPAELDAVVAFLMRLDDPEFVRNAASQIKAAP